MTVTADPTPDRINRVVVLGGGSAGFLAALSLRKVMPDLPVAVLRSKDIGVIGVGEGTTVSVPNFLHGYLGVDPLAFHRDVKPTFKLGIKFLWGPRPSFNYTFSSQFNMQYKALPKPTGFYSDDDCDYACVNSALMAHDKAFIRLPNGSPGVRNDVAYHIENADLVAFLESHSASLGVEIIDDTVESVRQNERGVAALACRSGRDVTADLWVDCSGFTSLLLGKTLGVPFVSFRSSLMCERAVVGGWQRDGEPVLPYTTAETMESGWCWQIEHDHRINRGYVYSPDFISDDEAEREFRQKNPKLGPTRIVKFVSGRYERPWVKNVVAIGNANGFVEPLESTSLAATCDDSRALAMALADSGRRPGTAMVAAFNRGSTRTWDDIRQFLALHYKYNTRLDTPFWRACRSDTDLAGAAEFDAFYREVGPVPTWRDALIRGRDAFGIEGYLAMMVGQRVPYRKTYQPTDAERHIWGQIRESNRQQAAGGLSMEQALAMIRSPKWTAKPDFYRVT